MGSMLSGVEFKSAAVLLKPSSGEKSRYILDNSNLMRSPVTPHARPSVESRSDAGTIFGPMLCVNPDNQLVLVNPTGDLGTMTAAYYSMCFFLSDGEYNLQKRDEHLFVSPAHAQFAQITDAQKDSLENKIKQSLAFIGQSVADYELVLHDMRKYRQILDYFKNKDETSLKTLFIEEVDYHAGQSAQGPGHYSMAFLRNNNIMPTIVQDFQALKSENDLEKDERFKNIPSVEREMLLVKWRAYQEWKQLFEQEVRARYDRLKILENSRKHSIERYREWIKSDVAKHVMHKEALDSPEGRKTLFTHWFHHSHQASAESQTTLWAWKDIIYEEFERGSDEIEADYNIDPCDEWTVNNLIFGKRGIVTHPDFSWITPHWIKKHKEGWINSKYFKGRFYPYYSFMYITFYRPFLKIPQGEVEDGNWIVDLVVMSKNVLFTKVLELEAQKQNMEDQVTQIIGLGMPHREQIKLLRYTKGKYGKFVVRQIGGGDPEKTYIKINEFKADKKKPKEERQYVFDSMKDMKKKYPDVNALEDNETLSGNVYSYHYDKQLAEEESFWFRLRKWVFHWLMLDLMFRQRGPYELLLKKRLTKFMFTGTKKLHFDPLINFIKMKTKMGVG